MTFEARLVSAEQRLETVATVPEAPLDPARWAQDVAGFPLDPWQRDVLTGTWDRALLNVTRQGGKSSIAALLALWAALYEGPALVLMLSPSLRQSAELFRKAATYYARRPSVGAVRESAMRMELANGSRIVSLPGTEKTTRGYSAPAMLIVDEAARVDDDLYRAIRPMLAVSGGRLLLLSTPWGRRGFFWEAWAQGDDWLKVRVDARQCPRISDAFLAEEERVLGRRFFAQEYLCSFEERAAAVFSYDLIQGTAQEQVEVWQL